MLCAIDWTFIATFTIGMVLAGSVGDLQGRSCQAELNGWRRPSTHDGRVTGKRVIEAVARIWQQRPMGSEQAITATQRNQP